MNTKVVTVKLVSSAVNCRNEAVKLAGLEKANIVGIHTQYVEPHRPDGMGFKEFFNLPRNCTIEIEYEG